MSECKCNMRTQLVGDGCEICNPAYAVEQYKLTISDLEAECETLRHDAKVMAEFVMCWFEEDNEACTIARKYFSG